MANYNEILGKDWARVLKPFLTSNDWKLIKQELNKCVRGIENMYPNVDSIFNAFTYCPYNELSVVLLTTNSYGADNDGVAFSSSRTPFMSDFPKVLSKIFDAIEKDVSNGLYLNQEPDLWRLAKQGMLLLNCDITSFENKPGKHLKLWHPFIKYVIKYLATYNTGLVYILIGSHAHKFERYIPSENNYIFKVEHPMLSVKENRPWVYNNIFSKTSEIVKKLNNKELDWTKVFVRWEEI